MVFGLYLYLLFLFVFFVFHILSQVKHVPAVQGSAEADSSSTLPLRLFSTGCAGGLIARSLPLLQFVQSFDLFEQEIEVCERRAAMSRPMHAAQLVNQYRRMQRYIFEIII